MYPYPGDEGGFHAPPPSSWQAVLTAMAETQKVSRSSQTEIGVYCDSVHVSLVKPRKGGEVPCIHDIMREGICVQA